MRTIAIFFASLALIFNLGAAEISPNEIVDRHAKAFKAEKEIPGLAIGLYYNDRAYVYLYGTADINKNQPVTVDTIFEIASITKVFTSTLLAEEVLRGKMSLNDPVVKYLPIPHNHDRPISRVTLKELATHTSSLPRVPPRAYNGRRYNSESLLRYIESWNPATPIGSHFLYSNMGFGLIGYAVANVSGKPYYALVKESILEPLGMRSTFIHVPPEYHRNYAQGYNQLGKPVPHATLNAWPAGGALHSTLADMILFLKANLGLTGPEPLLKAMQYAQQSYFTVNPHFDMGLGWQRINSKYGMIVDKNGGLDGSSSYIGMIPSENMGIVILTNKGRTQVTTTGRQILAGLSRQMKGQ